MKNSKTQLDALEYERLKEVVVTLLSDEWVVEYKPSLQIEHYIQIGYDESYDSIFSSISALGPIIVVSVHIVKDKQIRIWIQGDVIEKDE